MATWISPGVPPLAFSSQAIMSLRPAPRGRTSAVRPSYLYHRAVRRHAPAMPNQHLRTIFVVYASCTLRLLATWRTQTIRASPQPQPVPVPALSGASPHSASITAVSPGHKSSEGAHQQDWALAVNGCSRRISSVEKDSSRSGRDLRGHAVLPSYVPRERHTGGQPRPVLRLDRRPAQVLRQCLLAEVRAPSATQPLVASQCGQGRGADRGQADGLAEVEAARWRADGIHEFV